MVSKPLGQGSVGYRVLLLGILHYTRCHVMKFDYMINNSSINLLQPFKHIPCHGELFLLIREIARMPNI